MPLLTHPDMIEPKDNTIIRRYLSFKKFADLILQESLYLSSLNSFSDPWEGIPSKRFLDISIKELAELLTLNEKEGNNQTSYAAALKTQLIPHIIESRSRTYINCFTLETLESEPFWKLYSSIDDGICFETTVGELKQALREEILKFNYSEVQYYDSQNGFIPLKNALYFINHKRDHYKFEKEFRLISAFHEEDNPTGFLNAKVDLKYLIKKIILAPNSTNTLKETVQHLCLLKNLNPIIEKSQLFETPINKL